MKTKAENITLRELEEMRTDYIVFIRGNTVYFYPYGYYGTGKYTTAMLTEIHMVHKHQEEQAQKGKKERNKKEIIILG